MNEEDFISQWEKDKPLFEAWGSYVIHSICQSLERKEKNLSTFLKVPATCRIKDNDSLIDKAFYRPNKNYTKPYYEIEDKVGVRFIVLLLEDIDAICEIIKNNKIWEVDPCKHFIIDKEKQPLLFTYQSVHYIIKPKEDIETGEITIPQGIPCEVQIRTLLQHAHAELTHDAIYKAKKTVEAKVQRTVAKSMALIETTDDFFTEVVQELNKGKLEKYNIIQQLNDIYLTMTGLTSRIQKSSLVVWDAFEGIIDENLVDEIEEFFNDNPAYIEIIKERYTQNTLYKQSTVLFIYWLLKRRRRRLYEDWPLNREILQLFANDLGISISDF